MKISLSIRELVRKLAGREHRRADRFEKIRHRQRLAAGSHVRVHDADSFPEASLYAQLERRGLSRSTRSRQDDEEFVGKVIRLLEDGSLPKATAKKVAASLKKPENLQPLKVLTVLRRDIKHEFFQASPTAHASQALAPREVILSSWIVSGG